MLVFGVGGLVSDIGVYIVPVVFTEGVEGTTADDSHGIGIVHEGVVVITGGAVVVVLTWGVVVVGVPTCGVVVVGVRITGLVVVDVLLIWGVVVVGVPTCGIVVVGVKIPGLVVVVVPICGPVVMLVTPTGGVNGDVETVVLAHIDNVVPPSTGRVTVPNVVSGGITGVVNVTTVGTTIAGVVVIRPVVTLTSVLVKWWGVFSDGRTGSVLGTVGLVASVVIAVLVSPTVVSCGMEVFFVTGTVGTGVGAGVVRTMPVGVISIVVGAVTSVTVSGVGGFVSDRGLYCVPVVFSGGADDSKPLGIGTMQDGVVVTNGGVVVVVLTWDIVVVGVPACGVVVVGVGPTGLVVVVVLLTWGVVVVGVPTCGVVVVGV